MGSQSKTRCMENMERDLPEEVLEIVFTFLPIASLCRFRTLSKKWNKFITDPDFKHHARPSSEEEYALITQRWGRLESGWVVLDVARKRYFKLSAAFLTTHLQQQGLVVGAGAHSFLAAADGGALLRAVYLQRQNLESIRVQPYSPDREAATTAPGQAPGKVGEYVVVLATDRSSMEYEVLVKYSRVKDASKSILVYESKTGMWRTASYRPGNPTWWGSTTIFNNELYIVVQQSDTIYDEVVSYNKEAGVVSCICVTEDPSHPSPLLLVSQARLFYVLFDVGARYDGLPLVQVLEVDVAERESSKVTEMPHALLLWVFGHDLPNFTYEKCEIEVKAAFGSAECILIATIVGRCAAYDVSRDLWYQFADDRILLDEYCGADTDMTKEEIFGSSNCLSLCAP